MATDDAGIGLVSYPSTAFANNLLPREEICNNWLEGFYIIFDRI